MKSLLLILGTAVAVGTGAYAQSAFSLEVASNEPVQRGVIYAASLCGQSMQTSAPYPGYGGMFYLRVTRELNRGWLEVDYASTLESLTHSSAFNKYNDATTARINLNALCYVRPVTP